MFKQGREYWARRDDYRIRVTCQKRTKTTATFLIDQGDKRYLGVSGKITKKVHPVDGMFGDDCRMREYVPRVDAKWPGCGWWISDEEARPKDD